MSARLPLSVTHVAVLLSIGLTAAACRTEPPPPPPEPVVVQMYSSSTKEDWLNTVTDIFNGRQVKTDSGRTIHVEVFHVTSGGSQDRILNGEIEPTVWSPGDSSWVSSVNAQWSERTGEPLIAGSCAPTVYEPSGLAIWRPMAEAMGWPAAPVTWNDLFNLAADQQGWARYGHPEWGRFKIGLTNPENSNSGRLILTGLVYATLQRTEGLTPELVATKAVEEAFQQIGRNTAEFGERSSELLESMVMGGPERLHAINTNEAETLKTNSRYGNLLPYPLVFIIPADGTIWGEHPYCIVDAPWVSAEQRVAAQIFLAFLLEPEQQLLAVEKGLRPTNPSVPLGPPIILEYGADPSATPLTVPALESPSVEVAEAIGQLFAQLRSNLP